MKKSITFALMASLFLMPFITLSAQPSIALARITSERIEQLSQKVAKDLSQDTWKKRLVYTAALLACGYLGYRYYTAAPVEIPIVSASAEQLLANNTLLQANNALLRNALPGMEQADTGGTLSWLQNSSIGKIGSWAWDMGKWSVQQTLITYCANVLLMGSSKAWGKVIAPIDNAVDAVELHLFHDRDLTWFLKTRASYTALFDELESHARCLETGKMSAQTDVQEQELTSAPAQKDNIALQDNGVLLLASDYAYHVTVFQQTWNQLSERIASLAAFVGHKAATLESGALQERMQSGADQLAQVTNATATALEALLQDATINTLPIDMQYQVRRLRASISDELLHVNKLEHDISW